MSLNQSKQMTTRSSSRSTISANESNDRQATPNSSKRTIRQKSPIINTTTTSDNTASTDNSKRAHSSLSTSNMLDTSASSIIYNQYEANTMNSHHNYHDSNFDLNNNLHMNRLGGLIIDKSDLVVVTPIKANQLKIVNFCDNCSLLNIISNDVRLFGSLIQMFMISFVSLLLCLNLYSIINAFDNCCGSSSNSSSCEESSTLRWLLLYISEKVNFDDVNTYYYYNLKKCHITIILLNILFANFFTCILNLYDYKRFEIMGAYRPNEYILLFLMWSGGWLIEWAFLLMTYVFLNPKYLKAKRKDSRLTATLLSATGPLIYLMINSKFE